MGEELFKGRHVSLQVAEHDGQFFGDQFLDSLESFIEFLDEMSQGFSQIVFNIVVIGLKGDTKFTFKEALVMDSIGLKMSGFGMLANGGFGGNLKNI